MADRHFEYNNWLDMWSVNDIGFHKPISDPILDSKNNEIFGDNSSRVFVPLCGKSVDIMWMYSNGYSVVGVDIAEKAVLDFFVEHNITPDLETIEQVGKLYKTKDERIQIYVANIFDLLFDRIKKFDVIWDISGFCVINKEDRSKYVDFMKSIMFPTTKYFVGGPDYDKTVYPGPPHPTNVDSITEYFGTLSRCNMTEAAMKFSGVGWYASDTVDSIQNNYDLLLSRGEKRKTM